MMRGRWGSGATGIVVLAVVLGTLSGCGGGEDRVALAVTDVQWSDTGDLAFETECAEISEIEWDPAGGDGIPRIEIWGRPEVGRCAAEAVVPGSAVPDGAVKVLDATTSQVVDLPARS